jgi:hypothetical protein
MLNTVNTHNLVTVVIMVIYTHTHTHIIWDGLFLTRGPFEKVRGLTLLLESELRGGAVTVSFLKYLPWQVMHFLQRSTHFSKTCCCRPFATSFRRMVEGRTLPAEGSMRNFFGGGESLCSQTDDCCLVSGSHMITEHNSIAQR